MRTFTDLTRGLFAQLDSIALMTRSMNGYKNDGVFTRLIRDTLSHAQSEEYQLQFKMVNELSQHINVLQKVIHDNPKIITDVIPPENFKKEYGYFTMDNIISIALNMGDGRTITTDIMGNPKIEYSGNFQRLMDGFGLDEPTIFKMVRRIPEDGWKAIQGIWDGLETMRPEMEKTYKIMNYGLRMPIVEATPLTVKLENGKSIILRGGYYPIEYDPLLDKTNKTRDYESTRPGEITITTAKSPPLNHHR